jgi:hypothetical protein
MGFRKLVIIFSFGTWERNMVIRMWGIVGMAVLGKEVGIASQEFE